jgi:hypothetical protein
MKRLTGSPECFVPVDYPGLRAPVITVVKVIFLGFLINVSGSTLISTEKLDIACLGYGV